MELERTVVCIQQALAVINVINQIILPSVISFSAVLPRQCSAHKGISVIITPGNPVELPSLIGNR